MYSILIMFQVFELVSLFSSHRDEKKKNIKGMCVWGISSVAHGRIVPLGPCVLPILFKTYSKFVPDTDRECRGLVWEFWIMA